MGEKQGVAMGIHHAVYSGGRLLVLGILEFRRAAIRNRLSRILGVRIHHPMRADATEHIRKQQRGGNGLPCNALA